MKLCLNYFSNNYNYRNIDVADIFSYLIIAKMIAIVMVNMNAM